MAEGHPLGTRGSLVGEAKSRSRQLVDTHPETKVLFMSAYSVETARDYEVSLAPGEPFVTKPFSVDVLQRTVRAALDYEPPGSSK